MRPTHPHIHLPTFGRSCEAQPELIVRDDCIRATKPGNVVRLARSVEHDRSLREPLKDTGKKLAGEDKIAAAVRGLLRPSSRDSNSALSPACEER